MDHIEEISLAQLRREALEDRKARQLQAYIKGQIAPYLAMLAQLYPTSSTASSRQILYSAAAEAERLRPSRETPRAEVAIHEAGHFVIFEALGLNASFAEVHGSPFGRSGWGGSASATGNIPWLCHNQLKSTTDEVRRDVIATFAGPAAERALAGGNAANQSSEFFMLGIGAYYLAQQRRTSVKRELYTLVRDTARLIHGYRASIEAIAGCLTRRHRISRFGPRVVVKALAAVRANPAHHLYEPTPEQVADLLRLINSMPINLPDVVRSVAR